MSINAPDSLMNSIAGELGYPNGREMLKAEYCYKRNITMPELAKKWGVCTETISYWLRKLKLKAKKRGRKNPISKRIEFCKVEKMANRTVQEIAEQLGCTVSWVYNLCNKKGIPYKKVKPGRKT